MLTRTQDPRIARVCFFLSIFKFPETKGWAANNLVWDETRLTFPECGNLTLPRPRPEEGERTSSKEGGREPESCPANPAPAEQSVPGTRHPRHPGSKRLRGSRPRPRVGGASRDGSLANQRRHCVIQTGGAARGRLCHRADWTAVAPSTAMHRAPR